MGNPGEPTEPLRNQVMLLLWVCLKTLTERIGFVGNMLNGNHICSHEDQEAFL